MSTDSARSAAELERAVARMPTAHHRSQAPALPATAIKACQIGGYAVWADQREIDSDDPNRNVTDQNRVVRMVEAAIRHDPVCWIEMFQWDDTSGQRRRLAVTYAYRDPQPMPIGRLPCEGEREALRNHRSRFTFWVEWTEPLAN